MEHAHIGNVVVEQLEVLIHIHTRIHVQEKAELYIVVYAQDVTIAEIVEQNTNVISVSVIRAGAF